MPRSSVRTWLPQIVWPKPSRKKVMPIVAMNRMIGAWLTSGRSTIRSIAKASTIMTPTVMAKASQGLTPRSSISPAKHSAANSTMAPWAKLNTPDALKISTKPSATSEYMTPGHQAADQHLDEEQRHLRDRHERIDEDRAAAGSRRRLPLAPASARSRL